jgi:hypothetical protein
MLTPVTLQSHNGSRDRPMRHPMVPTVEFGAYVSLVRVAFLRALKTLVKKQHALAAGVSRRR